MAEHYGKTPAQICIKWNLQHGFLPLSKSVNEDRMRANLEVEDFEIAEEYADQVISKEEVANAVLISDADAYSAACETAKTRWEEEVAPLLVQ